MTGHCADDSGVESGHAWIACCEADWLDEPSERRQRAIARIQASRPLCQAHRKASRISARPIVRGVSGLGQRCERSSPGEPSPTDEVIPPKTLRRRRASGSTARGGAAPPAPNGLVRVRPRTGNPARCPVMMAGVTPSAGRFKPARESWIGRALAKSSRDMRNENAAERLDRIGSVFGQTCRLARAYLYPKFNRGSTVVGSSRGYVRAGKSGYVQVVK